MAKLVIPGIITIIVTSITGYFTVLVAKTSRNAAVATNGAVVASEKSQELLNAMALLKSMDKRLARIEQERDECREELKLLMKESEELRELLGMSKRLSPASRRKKPESKPNT